MGMLGYAEGLTEAEPEQDVMVDRTKAKEKTRTIIVCTR